MADGVWIFLDHTTPSWDQSHYLDLSWHYESALLHHGPIGLIRDMHALDPSQGPLYTILLLPFFLLFGPGPRSGLLLNLVVSPLLFLSGGEISYMLFRKDRARVYTIGILATMPLIVGLYHEQLVDFLLMTLVTLSVFVVLKCVDSASQRWAALLGLCMGLGTLTKVTFLLFLIGPLIMVALRICWATLMSTSMPRGESLQAFRSRGASAGIALAVFAGVVLPWYLPNLGATLAYVRSTTSGPLSLGAGPSNPLTGHAVYAFTMGMLNSDVSWIFVIVTVVGAGLIVCGQLSKRRRQGLPQDSLWRVVFLLLWILIPYASIAGGHNQDVRLMAGAMPGMAAGFGGLLARVPWPYLRSALVVGSLSASAYQTAALVAPSLGQILPVSLTVGLESEAAVIPFDAQPLGYEQRPGADYGTAILSYLEYVARGMSLAGVMHREVICFLESDPIINTNTFGYLVDIRNDPFTLVNLQIGVNGVNGLPGQLASCNVALYVPQPAVTATNRSTRLVLVNGDYAATFMTPTLVDSFTGFRRFFSTGSGSLVEVLVH